MQEINYTVAEHMALSDNNYIGSQNIFITPGWLQRRPDYGATSFAKTIEFTIPKGRSTTVLEKVDNTGYSNMRFLGDMSTIEYIELEIGGSRIDKIYPPYQRSFDLLERHILPSLQYHDIKIHMFATSELRMFVDVYAVVNPQGEMVIRSIQHPGRELINAGKQTLRLHYNHLIEDMRVYSTVPVRNMVLHLDDKFQLNGVWDGQAWCFTFLKPLNFSRVDCSKLTFEAEGDGELRVFATSLNILTMMAGYAGVKFSK